MTDADTCSGAAARTSRRPGLTKIIATIGPASDSPEMVERLIEAGVGIFRFNFSHGSMEDHERRLAVVRKVSDRMGLPIAVMGDLQGPKIRVTKVPGDGLDLTSGARVEFRRGDVTAGVGPDGETIWLGSTYEHLVDDAAPGHRLLLDDGAIRLLITDRTDESLICTVTFGGRVSSGKGINLPDSNLQVSALGERDRRHVEWAVEHEIDFLALSFVSKAEEIRTLAARIDHLAIEKGRPDYRLPIVAKIERPAAVERFKEIVSAADAIMVARGDLGVEMELARVPVVQKQLMRTAQDYGTPCIVATQMLQSMIENPAPTRAEASDVANALFDGADAVMLSGETAVGRFPLLAVEIMRRISVETEQEFVGRTERHLPPTIPELAGSRIAALANGVWTVARDIKADFVVVWSQKGGGARFLSQNDFDIPIIAVSTDDRALRQMQILRGVTPIRMPQPEDLGHFTQMIDAYVLAAGWAQRGEVCILAAGGPVGRQGVTNSLAIHEVGNPDTGFVRHREGLEVTP